MDLYQQFLVRSVRQVVNDLFTQFDLPGGKTPFTVTLTQSSLTITVENPSLSQDGCGPVSLDISNPSSAQTGAKSTGSNITELESAIGALAKCDREQLLAILQTTYPDSQESSSPSESTVDPPTT
jgi:hypothetical protein